jgi:hypothetical protein
MALTLTSMIRSRSNPGLTGLGTMIGHKGRAELTNIIEMV